MATPKGGTSLLSLARAAPKLSQWVVGNRASAYVKKAKPNSKLGTRDEVAVAAAAAARATAIEEFFLSVGFPPGPDCNDQKAKGQGLEKARASRGRDERSRRRSTVASVSRGRKKSSTNSGGT